MSLTVQQVVTLIGIHSIIHGVCGVFHVATSYYVNYNSAIITSYLGANVCILILGILIFCVVIWRSPGLCRFFAVLMILFVLFNLAAGIVYFVEYFPFFANSVFDGYFFYTDTECWVGSDYPVTFWHVITGVLLGVLPLWILYAILLCRLARVLACCPRPPPCPLNPCAPPPCPIPCPPPCPPPCPRKRRKSDELRCRESRCANKAPKCCPPPYSPPKKTLVVTLKPGKLCNL